MERSRMAKRIVGISLVLAIGVVAWFLLGAADAPDGGVHMTALAQPLVGTSVTTTGTAANVFVAVNSENGYVQGLTEENFRVSGLAGGDVRIQSVQSKAPGVYLLAIARADDGTWHWHEVIIAVTLRGAMGSGTTIVRLDIP